MVRDIDLCQAHMSRTVRNVSQIVRNDNAGVFGLTGHCFGVAQMDRAASHPLNFTEVATALKEVTSALESGASPEAAQKQAMQKVARGGGLTPSASAPVSSSKAAYRLSIENEP
jgi:hypothetical protein